MKGNEDKELQSKNNLLISLIELYKVKSEKKINQYLN